MGRPGDRRDAMLPGVSATQNRTAGNAAAGQVSCVTRASGTFFQSKYLGYYPTALQGIYRNQNCMPPPEQARRGRLHPPPHTPKGQVVSPPLTRAQAATERRSYTTAQARIVSCHGTHARIKWRFLYKIFKNTFLCDTSAGLLGFEENARFLPNSENPIYAFTNTDTDGNDMNDYPGGGGGMRGKERL